MEILVVEDEEGIADFLVRGLEAEGFDVSLAGDGITGERLALSRAADLVILDWMLPAVTASMCLLRSALEADVAGDHADRQREVADRVEGLDAAPPTTSPSPSPSMSSSRGSGSGFASPMRGRRRPSSPRASVSIS